MTNKREIIKSFKNSKIKFLYSLRLKKNQLKCKMFLVEGKNLIEEAKKLSLIHSFFTPNINLEGIHISQNILDRITNLKRNYYGIAIVKKPDFDQKISSKVLILDRISDPGNLGTLIRIAKAFDFGTIIAEGVSFFNWKTIRASQGAFFHVNLIQVDSVFQFTQKKLRDFKIFSAVASSPKTKNSFTILSKFANDKIALVLGSESHGISENMIKISDYLINIKSNFESLNVAACGAILMNYVFASKFKIK